MRSQTASSDPAGAIHHSLYDYQLSSPVRRGRNLRHPDRAVRVVDSWSGDPPVSAAELDVFEAHFAGVLEHLFDLPG